MRRMRLKTRDGPSACGQMSLTRLALAAVAPRAGTPPSPTGRLCFPTGRRSPTRGAQKLKEKKKSRQRRLRHATTQLPCRAAAASLQYNYDVAASFNYRAEGGT